MKEREFQNMFTFSPGFEAATLKIPSPDDADKDTQKKQIIGFAKFHSRLEALEARDILTGRKVDAEKNCILKAEMAKKNLHTKRGLSSLGLSTAMAATFASTPVGMVIPMATTRSVNSNDQNPPCNTLYVGNLPVGAKEEELRQAFMMAPGYKRMSFRAKPNSGPMCFVEFDTIDFATIAMRELDGRMLTNSVGGGIRLSYSKNPLGVR
ncbi:hypothetical protein GQ54DRAFT_240972, partial [Martensiomyces pterosporus]